MTFNVFKKVQREKNNKKFLYDRICALYIKGQDFLSVFFGTFVFRLKAFMFGVEYGRGIKCYGPIHIIRAVGSKISVGNNVMFLSSSPRCTASSIYAPVRLKTYSDTAQIIIEDDAGINGTSITARTRCIYIGRNTRLAPNVTIMDSDFHALWPPETRMENPALEEDRDVRIGNNVWIATQCIILKGVTIGENSIIAAGSVVTGDIPPNVIAGGVPAKVIRNLP
ncbi:MAG: acyltransferase [Clostridia bacterium]|nr:acyltransferase [Clostridia bacterium]